MDADIFVSGKKKLRIQKYPDTCGRGLKVGQGSGTWDAGKSKLGDARGFEDVINRLRNKKIAY